MDILRRKLANLVRGEEGVALVVTLALFMFLYVSSAGVFAIGRFVKDKIALQNAVDAAAYSAAVVEADTLSKIATINRAMAWKYVELVQLHMDYVTRQWLDKVQKSYRESGTAQRSYENKTLNNIDLTSTTTSIGDVNDEIASTSKLEDRIELVSEELRSMNDTIRSLRDTLVETSRVVAAGILAANLPKHLSDWCYGKVQFRNHVENTWLIPENSEERFLNNADLGETAKDILSKRFNDVWLGQAVDEGIRSKYEKRSDRLKAQWEYTVDGETWFQRDYNAFDHDKEIFGTGDGRDSYTEVELATPLKLTKSYFDENAGAITVAVAMRARNPWQELINWSDAENGNGIYDAFTPSGASKPDEPTWVYAVASAQAGYRPFKIDDPDGSTGKEKQPFAYSLIYDETENLRTDDWDAVFVPVRRAMSGEEFDEFMTGESDWEPVCSTGSSVAAGYSVRDGHLPRMHNSGNSMKHLDWKELLNRIYH